LVANDVVSDPAVNLLGTGAFQIYIAPVCSGHEGIGLAAASLTIYLVLFRQRLRFPQAYFLLPIGILAIWICNAVRITALILIGTYLSKDIARAGFHSQTGWIMFAAITIAIGAIALRLPGFAKSETELPETEN
jgi:exosortase E/protease (VPEID-CTERM system)